MRVEVRSRILSIAGLLRSDDSVLREEALKSLAELFISDPDSAAEYFEGIYRRGSKRYMFVADDGVVRSYSIRVHVYSDSKPHFTVSVSALPVPDENPADLAATANDVIRTISATYGLADALSTVAVNGVVFPT